MSQSAVFAASASALYHASLSSQLPNCSQIIKSPTQLSLTFGSAPHTTFSPPSLPHHVRDDVSFTSLLYVSLIAEAPRDEATASVRSSLVCLPSLRHRHRWKLQQSSLGERCREHYPPPSGTTRKNSSEHVIFVDVICGNKSVIFRHILRLTFALVCLPGCLTAVGRGNGTGQWVDAGTTPHRYNALLL